MPQLNPAPWLMTMIAMWAILLLMLMPKLLSQHHLAQPMTPQDKTNTTNWAWPWY